MGNRNKQLNIFFWLFIVAFTFVLYGNTTRNHYSLDDYHVTANNETTQMGIKAIPKIFTSLYAEDDNGLSFGWRPMVRSSFAIEYALWGKQYWAPYAGHLVNVLIYLAAMVVLFKLLRRLFRDMNPWFPFLITLIYMAHPLHTESVASLKNRDEIFTILFSLLALYQFIKWIDRDKAKYLVYGILFYILALISKTTAVVFLLIIPLTLYYFTDIKLKRLWIFSAAMVGVVILAVLGPFLWLPFFERPIYFDENPIVASDNIWEITATGSYILAWYIKKIFIPYPLLYYYGYDTIPVVLWNNIWAILGFIVHVALFIYALYGLKKKTILSYAILFYLITIGVYSNVIMPAPGIVAERFTNFPTLAFAIIVVWFIFKLFRQDVFAETFSRHGLAKVAGLSLLILLPYTAWTYTRNTHWQTYYSLYNHDYKWLENSVKGNDLLASEIMKMVNNELKKPVNATKFLRPRIDRAIDLYKKSIEIYPDYASSWDNLGVIYTRIYKEYDLAISYLNKAVELQPDRGMFWFHLADAYEKKGDTTMALQMFEHTYSVDTTNLVPQSRIANLEFMMGKRQQAVNRNGYIISRDSTLDLPYINLGNYHFVIGDTATAIAYYSRASEVGGDQTNVDMLLYQYFKSIGQHRRAQHYYYKAQQRQQ